MMKVFDSEHYEIKILFTNNCLSIIKKVVFLLNFVPIKNIEQETLLAFFGPHIAQMDGDLMLETNCSLWIIYECINSFSALS